MCLAIPARVVERLEGDQATVDLQGELTLGGLLVQGPLALGRVTLDVHTLLFAAVAVLIAVVRRVAANRQSRAGAPA